MGHDIHCKKEYWGRILSVVELEVYVGNLQVELPRSQV